MIKILNKFLKISDVMGLFIIISFCRYVKPEFGYIFFLGIASLLLVAIAFIRWLTTEPEVKPTHPLLPLSQMKRLRQSLHHSQVPVFEKLIEPLIASHYVQLAGLIIGKKSSEEPLTVFDEKMDLWRAAFRALALSNRLYLDRTFEGRDRAITLLVFLYILWGSQIDEAKLGDKFKTLPASSWGLLREDAYRLYDLPLLLTRNQLMINQEFNDLLIMIGLFNQPESSLLQKSKDELSDKVKIEECAAMESTVVQENIVFVEENINEALFEEPVIKEEMNIDADYLPDFMDWLTKRIAIGNKQFSLDSQNLVLSNAEQYDAHTVFLLAEVLGKYQSRSGIATEDIEAALKKAFSNGKSFNIKQSSGEYMEVLPCKLNEAFSTTSSTFIIEGENP